jgi:pimeloyl-ACP methyl ester carboxylesterase
LSEFEFPVGYHRFHRKQLFNFQLNRWYSLGYTRREDIEEAGKRIRNFSDWEIEMLKLAERAVSEGRLINAAFYYRAAEFYKKSNDPEKQFLYDKFVEVFYKVFANEGIERYDVPYEGAFLPALRIRPASEIKSTIIIHGGFDSFIEEWFSIMKYFSNRGYDVIGFEGPGQGNALRKYGLPLIYEWEKPTKAILDYFRLTKTTMLGLSMGGWFCLRAAAFEPRLERAIASGHAIDYMKSMNPFFQWIHLWSMKHCRKFMNRMAVLKFEKRESMASWVVDHLKFITKKGKPIDALEIYLQMNEQNIHSELVKQDVLLLAGREDHFVPFKMHARQIAALKNARSVTSRVFAKEEQAGHHCQTGNIALALDVIAKWLEETSVSHL